MVDKAHRKPSGGFIGCDTDKPHELAKAYKKVCEYDWKSIKNPFGGFGTQDIELLAQKIANEPKKAGDIYTLVRVRGLAQQIFRSVLLDAYDRECAMCGFSFEEALEAAHIIPWGECAHKLRMSPKNGILLCANHHKLFDEGTVSVTQKYKIKHEEEYSRDEYSESDEQATISFNGEPLRLPKNKKLRPCLKLLARREEYD